MLGKGGGIVAANEEDYLDSLLKSLSEKENEQKELKDEEEEEIKEQVREAVEKSNEINNQFENIYIDDPSENDGKQVSDEHVEKVLKEVMTVPRNMAAPDVDESYIIDETDITPEAVAKLAKEKESSQKADESLKNSEADKTLDKLLEGTEKEETVGTNLSKDDELVKDMNLSDGEKERLINMNLDDLISDVSTDNPDKKGVDAVNELLAQIGMEDNDSSEVADDKNNAKKKAETENIEKTDKSEAAVNTLSNESAKQLEEELKAVKKKKKGLFSIIKDIFFESIEDEETVAVTKDSEKTDKKAAKKAKKVAKKDKSNKAEAELNTNKSEENIKEKDENEILIEEVFHGKDTLDENTAPKKGLIAKIKYRIQQFKAKQVKEGLEEEQQEELERQEKQKKIEAKKAQSKEKKQKAATEKAAKKEQAKKAKANKPKKEKKPKKVKQPPKPGDIIRFKPKLIILFVMFIAGVVLLIQVFGYSINYNSKVSLAKSYYANQEFNKAYSSLSGIKLSGNDETLYNQSKVVMYVQRQYESYVNYEKMNMHTEALNALVKGVDRYQTYRSEAKELGVEDKMTDAYNLIIQAFKDKYKMSETDAIALVELSKLDFTNYYYKIEAYGEAVR